MHCVARQLEGSREALTHNPCLPSDFCSKALYLCQVRSRRRHGAAQRKQLTAWPFATNPHLPTPSLHCPSRYEDGDDKELAEKATVKLTDEEQAVRAEAIASGKRVVDYLNSR